MLERNILSFRCDTNLRRIFSEVCWLNETDEGNVLREAMREYVQEYIRANAQGDLLSVPMKKLYVER